MRTMTMRIGVVVALIAATAATAVTLVLPGASAAGAAVVLVQHPMRQSAADVPPNTDFVVPWTVAPTAGDTFLVAATNYCSVHPSTTQTITSNPGGWTQVNHALGTTEGGFMYGKLIVWRWTGAGVPANVVLQMQGATSSCDLNVATFEYRGLAADPIDVNTQATFDGTPAPWTLPTVTTSQPDELLFVALGSRAAAPWVNAITPGLTLEDNSGTSGGTSNMGIAIGDRVLATAGSYTPVASFCAGCGWHPGAVILGLRAAATTTTTTTTGATTTTRPSTTTTTRPATTTTTGPTTTTTTIPRTTTTTASTTTTTIPATTTTTTVPPPPGCPCSIWPTGVPAVAAATDAHGVDLGVKFRSDVAGSITGIRFYKGAGNTGVHIGNLWSSTGTLLATANFGGETASGWQTVTFATPVHIAAGTEYVASYRTNVGHYAYTYDAFVNQVDNAPLHALASAASGGNGVYVYGTTSQFPTSTSRSTNYWVDVVFVTS